MSSPLDHRDTNSTEMRDRWMPRVDYSCVWMHVSVDLSTI